MGTGKHKKNKELLQPWLQELLSFTPCAVDTGGGFSILGGIGTVKGGVILKTAVLCSIADRYTIEDHTAGKHQTLQHNVFPGVHIGCLCKNASETVIRILPHLLKTDVGVFLFIADIKIPNARQRDGQISMHRESAHPAFASYKGQFQRLSRRDSRFLSAPS